ncbi:MAG: Glu-tRNA(Gln) amidotransferase GatDE subunit E, partial [Candidatus Woesearchaeota archaeon]|nr:Glu-tRNA(Gln) amidotransferase GatDE subunit E [Candidatus Woesearchaeota archaeon]
QRGLIVIAEELKQRGVLEVKPFFIDTGNIFLNTECKMITETIKNKGIILGVKIEGFAGLIGKELQPNRRFGSELSDYAKIYSGVGGIFHSDELPKYGINATEIVKIKEMLFCEEKDGFVLVAAGKEKAKHALQVVVDRANQSLKGVMREVRKANPDGTTSFLRSLPGAARMYPETDIQPIKLTKSFLESVTVPELIEQRVIRYEKLGLSNDLATLAAKNEGWKEFDQLAVQFKTLKPAYIAEIFFTAEKTIERQFKIKTQKTQQEYSDLFNSLSNGEISKESVIEILKEQKPVSEVLSSYKLFSDNELETEINKIVSENKELPFNALIGKAMQRLRGKASGEKIVDLLKQFVQN